MTASPTWFIPTSTSAPRACRRTFELAGVAALCLLVSPAFAVEDECGGLKVPGYTAKRTIGKAEMRVAVTPEKERTEEIGKEGPIHITELATRTMSIMNPKAKTVMVLTPPKAPDAAKQKALEKYTEREPEKDGIVKVTGGIKTPKGKEWVVQTNCRVADGIWIERKIRTPQGIVESQQSDIKAETVPASLFEMPSDYKVVKPPPR